MPRILVALSLVALTSCGSGSPTTPTFPTVAGTWNGSLESANFQPAAARFDFSQSHDLVAGTWTSPADWNGTITGTVTASGTFSGSITISAPPAAQGEPRCTGIATLGGSVTASTFAGAGPGFIGTCPGLPQNFIIVARR